VPDLAFPNQLLYRSSHVFDRHLRIDAVLIKEIDDIDLESSERALRDLPDVFRPAVHAPLFAGVRIQLEAELGCDHDCFANGRECLAHQLLVRERAVDFRRVEEGDPAVDRRADQRNSFPPGDRPTVAVAQAHAAEPDGRDFQLTVSEVPLLHGRPPSSGVAPGHRPGLCGWICRAFSESSV